MSDAPSLLNDARFLAHRHVEGTDRIRFVRLDRAGHAAVPFITDEYLGNPEVAGELPIEMCLAQRDAGRTGLLFHSGFCGSTMVVRALDRAGVAMGLSEPMLLNDVVGYRRRGAQPAAVARLADVSLRLLSRPFAPDEAVVIKPSNVINPLAPLLLAVRPSARAVFLHAPLEDFLVSVARKGLACRLWARELLAGYLHEGAVQLGFGADDYFRQSDLQVAAVGWLAQQQIFARLARQAGPDRLITIDTTRLLDDPAASLGAMARHYGLKLDRAAIAHIVAGPVFTRHSKSQSAFSGETRKADYAAARLAHADEIAKVCVWAERVARQADVPLVLPNPLQTA